MKADHNTNHAIRRQGDVKIKGVVKAWTSRDKNILASH